VKLRIRIDWPMVFTFAFTVASIVDFVREHYWLSFVEAFLVAAYLTLSRSEDEA
jgi:hypothetical protein